MGRRSPFALGMTAGAAAVLTLITGCSAGLWGPGDGTSGEGVGISAKIDQAAVAAAFHGQKPTWWRCAGHPGFQCTTITVPLDYQKPKGRTIKLAVNRLRATDRTARIGSLITNPGGPGGSGLAFVYGAKKAFTAKVRARYDIVGIDPRGVGRSSPVRCLDDRRLDQYYATDFTPDDAAEKAELREANKQYAQACEERSGWLLPHVGTEKAARDMEIVRVVLGDKRLSYYGASYGTELGQVYAQLYPGKARRMVLDSVVDPGSNADTTIAVTQATAVQRTFGAFMADCVKRTGCPLGRTTAAATTKVGAFLDGLDAKPLRSSRGRPVTQTDAQTAMLMATYSTGIWANARTAFDMAFKGDGTGLRYLADAYLGRNAKGRYDPMKAANIAINCLSTPKALRSEEMDDELAAKARKAAPFFGGVYAASPCTYWPAPPTVGEKPLRHTLDGNFLLLANTGDNATPIEWARAVLARLNGLGVLLTNNADGHGVYGKGPCVNAAVDTYLIDGIRPAANTTCTDR